MNDKLHQHLQYQDRLVKRLQRLINMVNCLSNEDPLRHKHTIDYYVRELDYARIEADHLNEIVQQIIDRATTLHKQTKEKTNEIHISKTKNNRNI